MAAAQPEVAVDAAAVNEKAAEKRNLADEIHAVAGGVAGIGTMIAMRNQGSLSAVAARFSGQVLSLGTALFARLLAASATSSGEAAELLKTNDVENAGALDGIDSGKADEGMRYRRGDR